MSPFYIEPETTDKMRSRMDEYGLVMKQIAAETDCIFVDIQAVFNGLLKYMDHGKLAGDQVHPNMVGHMAIARAFLNAIDFNWNRG